MLPQRVLHKLHVTKSSQVRKAHHSQVILVKEPSGVFSTLVPKSWNCKSQQSILNVKPKHHCIYVYEDFNVY